MIRKRDAIGERRSPWRKKQDLFRRWSLFLTTTAGFAIAGAGYSVICRQFKTAILIVAIAAPVYTILMAISQRIFGKLKKAHDEEEKIKQETMKRGE